MTSPAVSRRLALAVLRAYPAAWRERYSDEMSSLIGESRLRIRDLVELLRGLLTERVRELISSDEHPARTAFVLSMLPPMFGLAFLSAAIGAAVALRELTGTGPGRAHDIMVGLLLASFAADAILFFAGRTRTDAGVKSYKPWVAPSLMPRLFATAVLFIAAIALEPDTSGNRIAALSPFVRWAVVLGFGLNAASLAACLAPSRRLLAAFMAVTAAGQRLADGRRFAADCRATRAIGLPAPVAEADAAVEHWTAELEAARVTLQTLGYRARFRREAMTAQPAAASSAR